MGHYFSHSKQNAPNATTATATPASHQAPVSDPAHQTTSPTPAATHATHIQSSLTHTVPSSSSVPLPSQLSHQIPGPAPTSSPAQSSHVAEPVVFYVPRNSLQVLDFSTSSRTPESKAKRSLLSHSRKENAIALVGMGGAGKTTIQRALGRDADVWAKFPDGVWFIQLGKDAKVQKLLDQIKVIVARAFPDFHSQFIELAASENTHPTLMENLVDRLTAKRFLLIFDDVWDLDSSVYNLVDSACKAVQGIEGACSKVLTSTRNEQIGRVPTHDKSIEVNPEHSGRETCIEILCSYAGIDRHMLSSYSSPNREALEKIIDLCAGLPLALSIAGSALQDVLGTQTDVYGQDGIVQCWESLEKSRTQLSDAEGGNGHVGLNAALQSSLESLEKVRKGKSMTVGEMFRSFCVMQKQMCLPLCAIEKLWNVNDALVGVRMFSRHSLVSLDKDEKGLIVGVRLHDLVHDLCMEMAKESDGVRTWHSRFVDAYRASIRACEGTKDEEAGEIEESNGTEEDAWWKLDGKDKYMIDNVVRHLLEAGCETEVLQLLTEYRWIEKMNESMKERPFQKIMSELQLLGMHLRKNEKTETGRRLLRDIEVVERAIELSIPVCMNNRSQCTFQLYGRLRDVSCESGVVKRIVCSIERYARRPWARAGPGVLRSGRSSLKRVLKLEKNRKCLCVGAANEVVVGGQGGVVVVLNSHNGTTKKSFIGHKEEDDVVGVFFDRSSELIYSCSRRGQVIIWKEYEEWRPLQAELQDREGINCMQVLPSLEKVVLGTDRGRLIVMDTKTGATIEIIDAHVRGVTCLAISTRKGIIVSGTRDGNIRVWDATNFKDSRKILEGHARWVNSVALTLDGNVLASGSEDGTIRTWDVQSGAHLWTSPDEDYGRVQSVLFSNDGGLLYSAHHRGSCRELSTKPTRIIRVWRVNNRDRVLSLLNTFSHRSFTPHRSLCIGDGSELFELHEDQVRVWDARKVVCDVEKDNAFLLHMDRIAVSEDEATILTLNRSSDHLEIRNMDDVSRDTDCVISSCKIQHLLYLWVKSLAVSNDHRFVAYDRDLRNCDVHVVDTQNGNVLHKLSDLEDWALSLTFDEQDVSSRSSSPSDSSDTTQVGPLRGLESIWFSPDGSVISAVAAVQAGGENGMVQKKSMSWNVSSGEPLDRVQLDGDSTASFKTAIPQMKFHKQLTEYGIEWHSDLTYEGNDSPFTIATLEDIVRGAYYVSDTSRMFISMYYRGMLYIDLVTDSTQLPPRDAPPLPLLSQPHPPPSHDQTIGTETDEVYDVFISHAGTDKLTIAEPLYELLVALGFKVFLDKAELRPGQKASQKMITAMRTAKIAVVILSPEFASRKWTLKELMCFLERFDKGGEREVIIIPVFYRLTLNDCSNQSTLFGVLNEKGENVFVAEKFLERMAQEDEYGIKDVLRALQSLRSVTGVENKDKVTNGNSRAEKAAQMNFVKEIRDAVLEAMERLKSGRVAGPSSV